MDKMIWHFFGLSSYSGIKMFFIHKLIKKIVSDNEKQI